MCFNTLPPRDVMFRPTPTCSNSRVPPANISISRCFATMFFLCWPRQPLDLGNLSHVRRELPCRHAPALVDAVLDHLV